MNRWLYGKGWWMLMIALFTVVVFVSSFIYYRIDLTAEKRFTLNQSTKTLLENVDTTINIKIFLTGNLPSDYKKLNIATQDLLQEFSSLSNNRVKVDFETPGEGLSDSLKSQIYDSLSRLGVVFVPNEEENKEDNKSTSQILIPSALIYYKQQVPVAVDLRSSRTVFIPASAGKQPEEDKEATLNAAENLLEFKFANAIEKLTRAYLPVISYLTGNGEPIDLSVSDLTSVLSNDYYLDTFNIKKGYPDAGKINALLIVKPTQSFTEEDKLKIDQYVMHGGKVMWFVDKLYAELDSLMRSQADFIAYDRNLNIDDILFKYGVRINGNLLQDLNCSEIPIVKGFNSDGSPQFIRRPWTYYPFLSAGNNNLISRNLNNVLSIFPSSVDTIKVRDIKKTILLTSDSNSRVIASPTLVSLNNAMQELRTNDFSGYTQSHVPVAVLLEGKFSSLFANRLDAAAQDSVTKSLGEGKRFEKQSIQETKQIVVSDADIVTNAVSPTNGPLPMGELPFENYRFANREFFLNSVDYLVSNNGIFESRNKDFVLRLLDKKKVAEQRTMWQFINIALPIALIILTGFILQYARKRRYA